MRHTCAGGAVIETQPMNCAYLEFVSATNRDRYVLFTRLHGGESSLRNLASKLNGGAGTP